MHASMSNILKRKPQQPWRLLAISFVLALLFGLLEMGDPLENALRTARNKANPVPASGDIVVVKIDDASQAALGSWPWPRKTQAEMVDRLTEAGASKILLNFALKYRADTMGDEAFAKALTHSGRVVLPNHVRPGDGDAKITDGQLKTYFANAPSGTNSLPYNYISEVWSAPYALSDRQQEFRSFSSILAEVNGPTDKTFPINYRVSIDTIPTISAKDLWTGKMPTLRGKRVIVGATADEIGDMIGIPGLGRQGSVFVHVLAAETLKRGDPLSLGWLPLLIALLPVAVAAAWSSRIPRQILLLSGATVVALVTPVISEIRQWFVDIAPSLFFLLCVSMGLVAKRFRARGTVNLTSGLPNLVALRAHGSKRDRALIVARVINYSHLAAAMDAENERLLIEQIVHRLTVGAADQVIYQGDEGIFAWMIDPATAIGHHVEALHSLFRSPARVAGETFDLNITFGVEVGSGATIHQRLNNALVAADEAAGEGLKWKYHDPERMKDASWRLSLLSQLDHAIDNGEVWVAFQPQVDLRTGRIRGAEALARWTHPDKGPISPQEFVSAAEQGGRIEKLTLFVLEQSIAAAVRFNRGSPPFDVAVNLSARMLALPMLADKVRDILTRHRLDPRRLTLELTETAALASDGSDMTALFALRDLGIRLSIDDYGTGLSTLDYLKKIPAAEIKIDQSFVRAMRDHRSDLVMVQSTIALAHSLDRTVVAEGVENQDLLDLLRSLGCDAAQGFLIGRPVSAKTLLQRLNQDRSTHAA